MIYDIVLVNSNGGLDLSENLTGRCLNRTVTSNRKIIPKLSGSIIIQIRGFSNLIYSWLGGDVDDDDDDVDNYDDDGTDNDHDVDRNEDFDDSSSNNLRESYNSTDNNNNAYQNNNTN